MNFFAFKCPYNAQKWQKLKMNINNVIPSKSRCYFMGILWFSKIDIFSWFWPLFSWETDKLKKIFSKMNNKNIFDLHISYKPSKCLPNQYNRIFWYFGGVFSHFGASKNAKISIKSWKSVGNRQTTQKQTNHRLKIFFHTSNVEKHLIVMEKISIRKF